MENRICKILRIEKPVIQEAMVWLTDARLVAAVGNAGGMGVLGSNAGHTEVTRDAEGTAENMRAEIAKVRELTDAPFAVNVLPVQNGEDIYTPPMLRVIYEEQVPAVVFVGEPDEAMFADLKAHDVHIIYRSLNPSPENARRAEAAGADIALGAEGVYCGTAFLMSKESRMAQNVKEAVLAADAKDLLLFRTIPAYYRSLPGRLAEELVTMDRAGASNEELGRKMGGFANLRRGMLEGDMDAGYVSVGNGISHIHEIRSCADIIAELTCSYR